MGRGFGMRQSPCRVKKFEQIVSRFGDFSFIFPGFLRFRLPFSFFLFNRLKKIVAWLRWGQE